MLHRLVVGAAGCVYRPPPCLCAAASRRPRLLRLHRTRRSSLAQRGHQAGRARDNRP